MNAEDIFTKIDMHGGDRSVCWEWKGGVGGRKDHPQPYAWIDGRNQIAYRIAYEQVHGPIPDGKVLRHSCDNSICCNPYHLTPGTHQENMEDRTLRVRLGLNAHMVKHIKKRILRGDKDVEIANTTGVSRQAINDIRHGRRRNDIQLTDEDMKDETPEPV